MNRTTLAILAAAGIVGAFIGWGTVGTPPIVTPNVVAPDASRESADATASDGPTVFPLSAADLASTREAPSLAVAPDGTVVLAWASETGESTRTLYLARSSDGGHTFGTPEAWRKVPLYAWTTTAGDRTMTFSTHVLPRLAAGPEALYLGWVEAVDGGPSATFFVARSDDGGATFGDPVPAHGPGSPRPGFTSLSVSPEGDVLATWIDNRRGPQQPFFSRMPAGSSGFEPEQLVYEGPDGKGICPCCDNDVIATPDGGAIVAFRNSDGGHRDIWAARAEAGEPFAPPVNAASDRPWTFEGCPHDGPSLTIAADRLVAAWIDASSGIERVAFAATDPDHLAFSTARELDPDAIGAQGHPTLASSPDGAIHAAWEAALDDPAGGRAIRYAVAPAPGAPFGPSVAIAPKPGAYQTHPTLAIGPDGHAVVAWNELDEQGKRIACLRQ